jgi:hypothetical protein
MIKLFYRAGYLPVHIFDPFIIHSTTCGTLRPIYRGVYIVGGPGEARDIFIHMDGSVAFGLSHHTLVYEKESNVPSCIQTFHWTVGSCWNHIHRPIIKNTCIVYDISVWNLKFLRLELLLI